QVRRTLFALAALGVPTVLGADPLAAARALLELLLPFLDRLAEGCVPRGAAQRVPDLVGRVGNLAQDTAEESAGCAKETACHAGPAGLEGGHVPVVAPVAVELELEPAAVGMVGVVGGEGDQGHVRTLPESLRV